MANNSPCHIPVLGNIPPIKIQNFDIFSWRHFSARSNFYLAPGGGCEVLFSPGLSVCVSVCVSVCACVCVCVWPIFWYFISQLLEEISIWNLYRILIGLYSIHWTKIDLHRSKVKVTRTVHYFLKVQSYHKNWAIEKFQFFFIDTS